jgi:hypothetical protein
VNHREPQPSAVAEAGTVTVENVPGEINVSKLVFSADPGEQNLVTAIRAVGLGKVERANANGAVLVAYEVAPGSRVNSRSRPKHAS